MRQRAFLFARGLRRCHPKAWYVAIVPCVSSHQREILDQGCRRNERVGDQKTLGQPVLFQEFDGRNADLRLQRDSDEPPQEMVQTAKFILVPAPDDQFHLGHYADGQCGGLLQLRKLPDGLGVSPGNIHKDITINQDCPVHEPRPTRAFSEL